MDRGTAKLVQTCTTRLVDQASQAMHAFVVMHRLAQEPVQDLLLGLWCTVHILGLLGASTGRGFGDRTALYHWTPVPTGLVILTSGKSIS